MSVQRTEDEGLVYLSLDGGGITTLSSLKIIKELMHRVQGILGLSEPPRPCDCFDFIVGSGFGGIIAIMLGRLRMTADEALVSLATIMRAAFSERNNVLQTRAAKFRSKNLDKAITDLVETYTNDSNSHLIGDQTDGKNCKTFICVMLAHHHGRPVRLRTYWNGRNQTTNYTIREALLATCAIPQLFEPVALEELSGPETIYVAAGLGCRNPITELLEESSDIFPNQHVACVLSIGAGQTRVADILDSHDRVLSKSDDVIDILRLIAEDCESKAEEMARRFRETTDLYFRFNVEQGLQTIDKPDIQQAGNVVAHAVAYNLESNTDQKLTQAAKAITQRKKHVTTSQLAGIISASTSTFHVKICPHPSPSFTGRKTILEMMRKHFFGGQKGGQLSFILFGLGGSGKTQIARMFIKENGERFSEVFYIDATSKETLEADLKSVVLAKHAGETLNDACTWFRSQKTNWLIFYDNADDTQLKLGQYIPNCSHGNFVITTRNRELLVYQRTPNSNYHVFRMSPEDARELLTKVSHQETIDDDDTDKQAAAIVKELDFFALAIVQAGAYIHMYECGLDEYLDIYRQDRGKILEESGGLAQTADDYERTAYTTWMLSYMRLSLWSKHLLHLLGFMHHDRIPRDIFHATHTSTPLNIDETLVSLLSHFNPEPQSQKWPTTSFLDVIKELRSSSLIDFEPKIRTYSIHPLVQSWIQSIVPDADVIRNSVALLLGLCVNQRRGQNDRGFRRSLLPHIDTLPESLRTEKNLASDFSLVYYEAGRWAVVESLETMLLKFRREELGDNHPDTLSSMHNLGSVYRERGMYDLATSLQLATVEARERLLGKDHPDTLTSMYALAWTYRENGNWKDACSLDEEVLERRRRVVGEDHEDTVASKTSLAWSYWNQGRLEEAEALEVEALAASKIQRGKYHPNTLLSMHNLAETYASQGRLSEAEELALEVVKSRTEALGRHHPHTLVSLSSLGVMYHHQHRFDEAEALQKEVLDARNRVLCENHPHTLSSMQNLGALYSYKGQWEDAEMWMTKAVEGRRRALLEDHPDTLTSMANLASIYANLGHWDKALELILEAVERRKRVLGADNPATLLSIEWLEDIRAGMGAK
ncbi:FabD/lysophospholipase-like protein [Ceratobasidium sp. AG-I]|nr:FabD/lysophospholipase-like protein [Ceratobasidium sp. AG-I]